MDWGTEKVDDHCDTDNVKQKMATLPGRFLFLVTMTLMIKSTEGY